MDKVLVVFDLDGVLVDTLPMLKAVYLKFSVQNGWKGNAEEFAGLNGYTIKEIVEFLKMKYQLKKDSAELLKEYQELIAAGLGEVQLSCGAEEVLRFLKEEGCYIGVASSAVRQYINNIFEKNGITKYFDFVVSGEEVKKAKPSPEIYERAIGKRQFDRCFIVEDSDNGIRAAQLEDERCRVVFYKGTQQYSFQNYHYWINDLRQLCQILKHPEETLAFRPVDHLKIEKEVKGTGQFLMKPEEAAWEQDVEKVWRHELKENSRLFNGRIFYLKGITPLRENGFKGPCAVEMRIYESEYKYFKWNEYKRRTGDRYSREYTELGFMPVAVSAALVDPEGNTLLARREKVTQYNHFYELVPSGSLDVKEETGQEQVYSQIFEELDQELAGTISEHDISSARVLGLCCDIPGQVIDICIEIALNKRLCEMNLNSNGEYDAASLTVMSLNDVQKIHSGELKLVPTSFEIIKHLLKTGNSFPKDKLR